jgi:hypothetical protein
MRENVRGLYFTGKKKTLVKATNFTYVSSKRTLLLLYIVRTEKASG